MPKELQSLLVYLREVRDPRPPIRLESGGGAVRDTGLRRFANPADLAALEVAVRLGEAAGAPVVALVLGPERLDDTLRLALSMGAGRAIRVWDDSIKDGDAVADAAVLQRVLEVLRPGLFVTGSRLLDSGDDPSPALAAAGAGLPCTSGALSCTLRGAEVEVLRRAEKGARQRVEASLPCAVLFDAVAAEPRYPELPALLAAMEAELELWGVPELGLPAWRLGFDGALLRPAGLSPPRTDPVRLATPDPAQPGHERVRALFSGGIRPRGGKIRFGGAEVAADRLLEIFAEEGMLPRASPKAAP
jgi:electron transfer flavoprotein beta subunit